MAVDKPSAGVKADYRMRFYNADGMAGEMCGNGARCICRYGYENGFAGEEPVVETTAGIITGKRINKQLYRIRLNDPSVVELNREYRLDDQYNIWNGAGNFAIKKAAILNLAIQEFLIWLLSIRKCFPHL